MEAALRCAAEPPLEIMRKCAETVEIISDYAEKGSALAISDAGCAAALAIAAMKAAALNVRINTKSMTDRDAADKLNMQAEAILLLIYGKMAEEAYEHVLGRLN